MSLFGVESIKVDGNISSEVGLLLSYVSFGVPLECLVISKLQTKKNYET